ncbi:MAG: hypothetical protein COV76_04890 [Candidatus Omnitrophica bacterium CG11_big_fil_rev_8_21_14_0_20_64_10]|nr:MAG: hypothetical protein COV76_04890 [Candidatus Omnitrophica bacterium CG11_big_fil_rev_8_21_14_0_20_64_10]
MALLSEEERADELLEALEGINRVGEALVELEGKLAEIYERVSICRSGLSRDPRPVRSGLASEIDWQFES